MAISRPFLLALIGLALLGATVFAVNNARNSGGDDGATPTAKSADQAAPAPTPAPAPAQASGKLGAREAVAAILTPGEPVDSARFTIKLDTKELGGGREHDYASVAGMFVSKGQGSVPDFDVRVRNHEEITATKPKSDMNSRVMVAGGQAYVGAAGELYRLPDSTVKGMTALRGAFDVPGAEKVPQFDMNRWLDDVKVVGVEKLDGVDATHVSGRVLAGPVTTDIMRIVRSEAEQAGSQPDVPSNVRQMAKNAVKKARFDAWVGSDRVVRRMTLGVEFVAPKRMLDPGDTRRWTADLDVRLSEVNKVAALQAPANVSDQSAAEGMGAKDAKDATGVLALTGLAVDAPGGVVGGTYSFLRLGRMGASEKVSKKALRAVEQGKEVVLFFNNPRALDDQATAESVKYLKAHTKKLVVFTDDVEHTRSYGELVEKLGVTQAPAIVFINRRGKASLVEGYVDGPSLVQVVADAR